MVQKVFRIREAKHGTKAGELLQTGADGHQRIWQNDEKNPSSRGRKSPNQRDKELENRGTEEIDYEKGVSESKIFLKWKVLWQKKVCGIWERRK